jgi:phosphate transport system protein
MFTDTITAVKFVDLEISSKVIEKDDQIYEIEREIENECLKIISLQRPFAFDLRLVTGYLKVVSDLQRVAVHCADICEIILMKNLSSDNDCMMQVTSILTQVYEMYEDMLKSYSLLDVEMAKIVYRLDDAIDSMFSDIVFSVSSSISDKLLSVRFGADLMFIAKYAERIGDRCVNISKWVIYIKDGFFPNRNYFKQ